MRRAVVERDNWQLEQDGRQAAQLAEEHAGRYSERIFKTIGRSLGPAGGISKVDFE